MRNLSFLPHDLHKWIEKSKEEMKPEIGQTALEISYVKAPKETGFLQEQGELYIDGVKKDDLGKLESGYRRVAIPSKGDYDSDITIVYRAGRPSEKHGVFDYAAFVGIFSPNHLKNAMTKQWIESALNPRNRTHIAIAHKNFEERWKYLKHGN